MNNGEHINLHPIGGIWGGNKRKVLEFIDNCEETIRKSVSENILHSEEQIMEIVLSYHRQDASVFTFDTWVHNETGKYRDWGDDFRKNIDSHKSFFEIFKS